MTKSKYSTSNVSQTIGDAEYLDLVNRAQFLNYTCVSGGVVTVISHFTRM